MVYWCSRCKVGWGDDEITLLVEPDPYTDIKEPTLVARCPKCECITVAYEFTRKES